MAIIEQTIKTIRDIAKDIGAKVAHGEKLRQEDGVVVEAVRTINRINMSNTSTNSLASKEE